MTGEREHANTRTCSSGERGNTRSLAGNKKKEKQQAENAGV